MDQAEVLGKFVFSQSVAKILDNMGFSAATEDALNLMSVLMTKYFEDLCKRTALNAEGAGRCTPVFSDAWKAMNNQGIKLTELHDYVKQVGNLPHHVSIPSYPVQETVEGVIHNKITISAGDSPPQHFDHLSEDENSLPSTSMNGVSENHHAEDSRDSDLEEKVVEEVKEPVVKNVLFLLPPEKKFTMPSFTSMKADDLGFDNKIFEEHNEPKLNGESKMFDLGILPEEQHDRSDSTNGVLNVNNSFNSEVTDKIDKEKKKHKKEKKKDKEKKKEKKHREPKIKPEPVNLLSQSMLNPDTYINLPTTSASLVQPQTTQSPVKSAMPKINWVPAPKTQLSEPLLSSTPQEPTPTKLPQPALIKPEVIQPISPISIKIPPPTTTLIPQNISISPPTLELGANPMEPAPTLSSISTVNPEPEIIKEKTQKHHKKNKEKKEKKKDKKKDKEKKEHKKRDKDGKIKNEVVSPTVVSCGVETVPINISTDSTAPISQPTIKLKFKFGSATTSIDGSQKSSPNESIKQIISPVIVDEPPMKMPKFEPMSQELYTAPAPAPVSPVIEEKMELEMPKIDKINLNVSNEDNDETGKKRKKEKKHKKEKDREGEEKHKKKSKEHKEKKEKKKEKEKERPESRADSTTIGSGLKLTLGRIDPLPVLELSTSTQTPPPTLEVGVPEEKKKKSKESKKHKKEKKHKREKGSPPRIIKSSSKAGTPLSRDMTPVKNRDGTPIKGRDGTPSKGRDGTPNKIRDNTPSKSMKINEVIARESPKLGKIEKPKKEKKKAAIPAGSRPSSAGNGKFPKKPRKLKEKKPKEDKVDSEEGSKVWVCPKCSVAYIDGQADMVGCDGCEEWYHWNCVGMLRPPAEDQDWYCPNCAKERKKGKGKGRKK